MLTQPNPPQSRHLSRPLLLTHNLRKVLPSKHILAHHQDIASIIFIAGQDEIEIGASQVFCCQKSLSALFCFPLILSWVVAVGFLAAVIVVVVVVVIRKFFAGELVERVVLLLMSVAGHVHWDRQMVGTIFGLVVSGWEVLLFGFLSILCVLVGLLL